MLIPQIPTLNADAVAWISETDMIEVDRVMIEDLHIGLIQMMENAGRNLAQLVLKGAAPTSVAVAAGSGGNGGGGLVAARHLANAGVEVAVVTTRSPANMSAVPAHQLDILERMGVPRLTVLPTADVVIDALIGYSLRGAPRGTSQELINKMADAPLVVSLDTPSGVNVTTGETPGAAVQADATLTLALPKRGLRDHDRVGEVYLADISVPPAVTANYGIPPRFHPGGIVRIS